MLPIDNITSPKQLSPLNLAFIGDAVFELMVRTRLLQKGNAPVNQLHRQTVKQVCAGAQAEAFALLEELLTEDEQAIFKRGRNANSQPPKNADPAAYQTATGLEALFGYLYVKEDTGRLEELFSVIWQTRGNK